MLQNRSLFFFQWLDIRKYHSTENSTLTIIIFQWHKLSNYPDNMPRRTWDPSRLFHYNSNSIEIQLYPNANSNEMQFDDKELNHIKMDISSNVNCEWKCVYLMNLSAETRHITAHTWITQRDSLHWVLSSMISFIKQRCEYHHIGQLTSWIIPMPTHTNTHAHTHARLPATMTMRMAVKIWNALQDPQIYFHDAGNARWNFGNNIICILE